MHTYPLSLKWSDTHSTSPNCEKRSLSSSWVIDLQMRPTYTTLRSSCETVSMLLTTHYSSRKKKSADMFLIFYSLWLSVSESWSRALSWASGILGCWGDDEVRRFFKISFKYTFKESTKKTCNIYSPVNISPLPAAVAYGWWWGSGRGPRTRPGSGSRPAASRSGASPPVATGWGAGDERARRGRRTGTALWTCVMLPVRVANREWGSAHQDDEWKLVLFMDYRRLLLLPFWRARRRAGGGGRWRGARAGAGVWTVPPSVPPSDERAGRRRRKCARAHLVLSGAITGWLCGGVFWERQNLVWFGGRLWSGPGFLG